MFIICAQSSNRTSLHVSDPAHLPFLPDKHSPRKESINDAFRALEISDLPFQHPQIIRPHNGTRHQGAAIQLHPFSYDLFNGILLLGHFPSRLKVLKFILARKTVKTSRTLESYRRTVYSQYSPKSSRTPKPPSQNPGPYQLHSTREFRFRSDHSNHARHFHRLPIHVPLPAARFTPGLLGKLKNSFHPSVNHTEVLPEWQARKLGAINRGLYPTAALSADPQETDMAYAMTTATVPRQGQQVMFYFILRLLTAVCIIPSTLLPGIRNIQTLPDYIDHLKRHKPLDGTARFENLLKF